MSESGKTVKVVSPHRHAHHLADTHQADARAIGNAIAAARRAQRDWSRWRFEDRAAVFLKAAELLAGPWRQRLNAATMLGQSKTVFQAEIDSACEIIDFLRFNVHFAERVYAEQPISPRDSGTGWTIGLWKDSSTPSRRSTSPPLAPIFRRLRR